MKRLVLLILFVAATITMATACGSLPFIGSSSPTDTPTRTPRPTFTPRASTTSTAAPTDTEAATETPAATQVPVDTDTPEAAASDTPIPVARATRPPAPPAEPTQPPAPQFAVHPDFGAPAFCPQDGIYEVVIYVKRDGASPRPFAGGLYYGVFSGGQILRDGAGKNLIGTTDKIGSLSYGANCNVSYDRLHPNQSNGKLDVGDAVRQGTNQMVLRFIRSDTDLTPISADVPLDFSKGGRWWTAFGYSGG